MTVKSIFTNVIFFLEICLLKNEKRVASVIAVTFCNLLSLSSTHFWSVLDYYPDMKETLEAVAMKRLHAMQKRIAWHKAKKENEGIPNVTETQSSDDENLALEQCDDNPDDPIFKFDMCNEKTLLMPSLPRVRCNSRHWGSHRDLGTSSAPNKINSAKFANRVGSDSPIAAVVSPIKKHKNIRGSLPLFP